MTKPKVRLAYWLVSVAALVGCSKTPEPTNQEPVLVTGTVQQAVGSCPAVSGGAATCTLDKANVAADGTVYETGNAPFDADTVNTNYDARELCVAQTNGTNTDDRRSAIKWNFSVVPANVIVTSATLHLFAARGGGLRDLPVPPATQQPTTLGIHKIQSGVQDWTESGTAAANRLL